MPDRSRSDTWYHVYQIRRPKTLSKVSSLLMMYLPMSMVAGAFGMPNQTMRPAMRAARRAVLDGVGVAGHLEDDVGLAFEVGRYGVVDFVGAHLERQVAAIGAAVDTDHALRAVRLRNGDGRQADRSQAEDEHGLAGNVALRHDVDGVAERLLGRHDLGVEARVVAPCRADRDRGALREAAVASDAEQLHVLADVAVADLALVAMAAEDVRLGADEIADLERAGFTVDLEDLADELMSHHHRRRDVALAPRASSRRSRCRSRRSTTPGPGRGPHRVWHWVAECP